MFPAGSGIVTFRQVLTENAGASVEFFHLVKKMTAAAKVRFLTSVQPFKRIRKAGTSNENAPTGGAGRSLELGPAAQ